MEHAGNLTQIGTRTRPGDGKINSTEKQYDVSHAGRTWEAIGKYLSEAKTSGNLATWIGILLSLVITLATVFVQAGRIIDRQDSIKDTLIVTERNRDREVEELRIRLTNAETENKRLSDRLTSTRELVIAAGIKSPQP